MLGLAALGAFVLPFLLIPFVFILLNPFLMLLVAPVLDLVSVALGVAAVIAGIRGRGTTPPRRLAIVGMTLGVIACVCAGGLLIQLGGLFYPS
ncbi:hypothetical protein KK092_07305 [Curtobacterium flaccumfaciens pv. flaccumfaciens]|uniref:hypothetical protein n=1 Tax=Curtobacterium flaccumfaciens TaxID=2035 RepID=UPI001BDE08D8|nr:hypothetical protein [Curtobacterium flaccumfaciens]MBT1669184.1 hypothetical protein [Curtobacterium flaccumfaciens pv. flaccumfaciens]